VDISEATVLHVLPHVHRIGNGIVDVTVDLAIAQAASGLDVVMASAGGEYEELLAAHGVTCVRLTLRPEHLLRARRLVRRIRPDLVHTHTLKGLVLTRLAAPRARILKTAHRDLGRASIAMRLADRVIAVSDGIAEALAGYGVDRRRIRVIRNGVLHSPRRQALMDLPPAELAHPAVVYVGGLYTHKGVGVLLNSFARLVRQSRDLGARLYLVGDAPERSNFERLAATLGITERVEFVGFRRDAVTYLRAADVVVLPSLLETFGLVLAEAREVGAAIIGATTGGIPEVLEAGRAGVLVPAGDEKELADAVHMVLADGEERARLRKAAGTGLEWLTVDRMNEELLREYAGLLRAR
jgi:glycosyltransferase involved in cell wall biosynthesis